MIDLTRMNEKITNLEKISFCITTFLTSRGMLQEAIKDYNIEFSNSNFYPYLNMGDLFKTMMGGIPFDLHLCRPPIPSLSLPKKVCLNSIPPLIENKPLDSSTNQNQSKLNTPLINNHERNINSNKEILKSLIKKDNYPSEVAFNAYGISPAALSNKISPNLNYSQYFPSPSINFQFMGNESPNPHYFSQLNDYARSDNQSFSPKN